MHFRTRTWFIISLLCFFVAAVFWQLAERKAERDRARQPVGSSAPAPGSVPNAGGQPGNAGATPATTPAATTNAATLSTNDPFRFRLSNTAKGVDELSRSEQALLLRNALIDSSVPVALPIPQHLRAQGDPGSYVVQSRGPLTDAYRTMLRTAGAEVISYVPNNAYLVRATEAVAKQLAATPQTQVVLPWEPYYKLDWKLLAMAVGKEPLPEKSLLNVLLFPGERENALQELRGLGVEVMGEDRTPFGPQVTVRPPENDWMRLASSPRVQGIERHFTRTPVNDLARARVKVSTNVVAGGNYKDLTGAGVLVNVNDTGIDSGHPDLSPRVTADTIRSLEDLDGHGTHVAGIIASSGQNGPAGELVPGSFTNSNYRGMAPEADLFAMPIDLYFGPRSSSAYLQETAAATNALISNNSWGYPGANDYTFESASWDAAARDALPGVTGSQPLVLVFAAGNSGDDSNDGLGGTPGSVIAPATAKNVISVGAIESFREITNEVRTVRNGVTNITQPFLALTDTSNRVTSFSSRGNVGAGVEGLAGRFKPDVVAPGAMIVSTRSSRFNDPSSSTNVIASTLPDQTVARRQTNLYSVFVRNNGIRLVVEVLPNNNSPKPFPPLLIHVSKGTFPTSADYKGTNIADLPATTGVWFYSIGNTNGFDVDYDVRTLVVVTNNVGTYFEELEKLNDLVGPNYRFESGTSQATPVVSGMLALMQEFFAKQFSRTNSPALMKALLINGARTVDAPYDFHPAALVNHQGWGLVNITNSIPPSISDGAATGSTNSALVFYDQSPARAMVTGQSFTRLIDVDTTARNFPLRFTLVWTDPPGNPSVGLKLVNDLDLIVTNIATKEVYVGNDFGVASIFTSATSAGTEFVSDNVNNVENVFIDGPLSSQYSVTVRARRVNVNAVTAQTNGTAQDYALVISSDRGAVNGLKAADQPPEFDPSRLVTIVTNGVPLLNQRVGASSPLLVSTNGVTNQWRFYVVTNALPPSDPGFPNAPAANIAFVTFLTPNLSLPRYAEADIDMFVTLDGTITNLNKDAIEGSWRGVRRGGTESVIITNAVNQALYYVGIKSEDQQAANFGFFAVSSSAPFSSEDTNGNVYATGYPIGAEIPDGTPASPQAALVFAFVTQPITVRNVIVTNDLTHDNWGDLLGNLSHDGKFAVLNNHRAKPDGVPPDVQWIYDESDSGEIPEATAADGPGSLRDFAGEEGAGVWQLTMIDNSPDHIGNVDFFEIKLEPQTDDLTNGVGVIATILPNQWYRAVVEVPADATNLAVCVSPDTGPVEIYIRRGNDPDRNVYDTFGTVAPPGDCVTLGLRDSPPLSQGRYFIGVFNPNATPVTVNIRVRIDRDLNQRSTVAYRSGGSVSIFDDAVTNAIIHVNRDQTIADLSVGVRIDHPRVADLVLHLVSPSGTRVLLAENRGRDTANYGFGALQTNVAPASSTGGALANTNIIGPLQNEGTIQVDYEFFNVPDRVTVYYDDTLIFDSGLVSGAGTFSVDYGPGTATNLVVIMNEGGNPNAGTLWQYTATVYSGYTFATFTENTTLAKLPIKFAQPPFTNFNYFGTSLVTNIVLKDGFDATPATCPAPIGVGTVFGGWQVVAGNVDVLPGACGMVGLADSLPQFVDIDGQNPGTIRTNLTTIPGENYVLSFAYSQTPGFGEKSARVSLSGGPSFVIRSDQPNSATRLIWQTNITAFTATLPITALTVQSLSTCCSGGIYVDSFLVQQVKTNKSTPGIYFLPEEPLIPIRGENAFGDWKLEIWDNRVGGALTNGVLLAWKLDITFVNTNPPTILLTNGQPFCSVLGSNETAFFRVDVPITAGTATNLVTGLDDLDFSFNQVGLPVGTQPPDTFFLTDIIGGKAVIGISGWNSFDLGGNLFDGSTVPAIQPGKRYYLAVRNKGRGTNAFCVEVGFDQTTPNLVGIVPLTNGCVTVTDASAAVDEAVYYSFDVSTNAIGVRFDLSNITGEVDLVVSHGVPLPTATSYYAGSFNGGDTNEFIEVADFFGTLLPGRWYIGVVHRTAAPVSYTLCASEVPGPITPILGNQYYTNTIAPTGVSYFKVLISSNAYLADFALTNNSGDIDLYISTNTMTPLLSAPTNAMYSSTNLGVVPEFNRVSGFALTNALTPGLWFIAVVNRDLIAVDYRLRVTEYTTNLPYITLTNGIPYMDAVDGGNDPIGIFKFDVSPDAIQVVFETFAADGDVDLYIRYGLPAPQPGPPNRFTFASANPGTADEFICLYQGGPQPLLPGTYYISVIPKPGPLVNFKVRATQILATNVQSLANGVASCQTVPEIDPNQLYTGVRFYSVDVPRGAIKATFETFNASGNVDLYIQPGLPLTNFTSYPTGLPPVPYSSENPGTANEFFCLSPLTTPTNLSQGRWYVTVVTRDLSPVDYCIRASVLSPDNIVELEDGIAECEFVDPNDGSPLGGFDYYVFNVSSNAVQAKFETFNAFADGGAPANVDLYVTRDVGCLVTNIALNAAYASTNLDSLPETICVTSNSTLVPLAPGDWYVVVANRSATNAVGYCVRATQLMATNLIAVTNATSICRTIGVGNGAMNTGIDYYHIGVSNSPVLATFQTFNADGNVDLYLVRDLCIPNFATFDASSTNYPYSSTNPGVTPECISIATNTVPVVLTNGDWYVAVVNRDATNVNYCFLAELFTVNPTTPLANNVDTCNQTVPFSPLGGPVGVRYYSFTVSTNALQVTFDTFDTGGNIDLYVQNGFCFPNRDTFGFGTVNAPYSGTNGTGDESICIHVNSAPVVLQPGEWTLAVVNREPIDVEFCVRARELLDTDVVGLINEVGYTPAVAPVAGEVDYYHYKVSPDAIAVNFEILQPSGNVDLFLDPSFCPNGLANFAYSSVNPGTNNELIALAPDSTPIPLAPGEWLIAVANQDAGPVTYTIRVTEILAAQIVRLTNAVPFTNTVSGTGSLTDYPVDYYVFNVSTGAVRAQFEILAPSGDVTLVARKGLPLPNLSNSTLVSGNSGTGDELIVLFDNSTPVALSPGDWYLAVLNNTGAPVNYAVVASEYTSRGTNVYIQRITIDANGLCLTFTNTLPGVNYYVLGVTNLGEAWMAVSTTIKATGDYLVWCTPLPTPYHFFRITEGLSPLSVQAPVTFFSPAWTSGNMVLQWTASPNRQFVVEWTDSISPSAWQPVPGNITSATATYTFTDDGTLTAPLTPNRFYRVRQLP